jgi:hypothetical protein
MLEHRNSLIAAALLALGLAVAGWFVGRGIVAARTGDRYVTVRGLAEREVEANLALWPIRYVVSDNDLEQGQLKVERARQRIMAFLARHQIDSSSVEVYGLEVTDALANPYQEGDRTFRYVVQQTLMVRSDDARRVRAAAQDVGQLVQGGIALTGGWGVGPTYLFTRLNDVKPAMIREATAAAREAATQFAADAASRLGGIRTASQGLFVILPRDQAPGIEEPSQLRKTVRVVTTVEYFLK